MDGIAAFAEQDLTRAHRLFLRLRNPAYVFEKAGEYWGRFYDADVWRVERLSKSRARGELSGIPETHPVFCRFITANITRMFQLAVAQSGVAVHSRCVCRGAPACVYEGNWSEGGANTVPPAAPKK